MPPNAIRLHLRKLAGSSPTSAAALSIAEQLYEELLEVKQMYEIVPFHSKLHNLIYFTAKPSKDSEPHIFIPYSVWSGITLKNIADFQDEMCNKSSDFKRINMAFIESDSTIVFYAFTRGLLDIHKPESLVRLKTREDRRNYINSEIKKNRRSILIESHKQIVIDD